MFEQLYFHEVFVHLNFRCCACSRAMSFKTECKFTLKRQKQPPEVFCKKGSSKNFAKFTGEHLYQSLFFKKETLAQAFSCEFCEISKNAFFTEQLLTTASDVT